MFHFKTPLKKMIETMLPPLAVIPLARKKYVNNMMVDGDMSSHATRYAFPNLVLAECQ